MQPTSTTTTTQKATLSADVRDWQMAAALQGSHTSPGCGQGNALENGQEGSTG